MQIRFTVYMDPVAKGRPKFSVRGGFPRAYTPKKTVSAENEFIRQAMPHKPSIPLQKWAEVTIYLFMPIPASFSKKDRAMAISGELRHTKKPDLDNLAKLVLDPMNGVFFRDDSIITSLCVYKSYHQQPSIAVLIDGE